MKAIREWHAIRHSFSFDGNRAMAVRRYLHFWRARSDRWLGKPIVGRGRLSDQNTVQCTPQSKTLSVTLYTAFYDMAFCT